MKKVGLLFGSFNPIHSGHLIIAEYFASQTALDEVWLVVSPHNPLKEFADLAPENHRLMMVNLAITNNPALKVCDLEFRLPRPSYTVHTLEFLRDEYPQHEFTLILGGDIPASFHRWKSYQSILSNYSIRIFPRLHNHEPAVELDGRDLAYVSAPVIEISSTYLRELIRSEKSIRYLTTSEVIDYIGQHNLYR